MHSFRRSFAVAFVLAGLGAGGLIIPAHAEESCPAQASGPALSAAQVKQSLMSQGFTTVRGLLRRGGCYMGFVISKSGKRGEVMVDAASGRVVTAETGGQ